MNKKEIDRLVSFARQLTLEAGAILRKGFRSKLTIRFKGRIDPVTTCDLKAEEHIVGMIAKKYPHHAVLAEEGSGAASDSEFRWIIDPLDGTVNFAHGFPFYCCSVGLEYRHEIIAGAVYDPERDEMFSAGRGMRARLNDKLISVSSETRLDRALITTGFAYDVGTSKRNNLGLFARMAKKAQGVRRPGSAAIDLCWLAAGRIDGFWEFNLYPWDTAAGSLIVRQAGGKISRLNGSSYSVFDKDLLASNGKLHLIMKKVLVPTARKN